MEGQPLNKVYREGKELWFAFENKNILAIHLMLRGKLNWMEGNEIPKHTLLELAFEDNKKISLTDYQHNAKVTLNPPQPKAPDALDKSVNAKFWKENMQSRATIKNLLLNQQVIRGIGNAYADEILWAARISPFSISKNIPESKIASLTSSVKKVLNDAKKEIKKAEPEIIGGEIRDFLVIHNPKQKKSPTGAGIHKKDSGGRSTYYTDEQQLY